MAGGQKKNRSYSERRHNRHVKGMRRIKEDRAQHGNDHSCSCFDTSGRGRDFARFADYPKVCSNPGCCGNPRRTKGNLSGIGRLTRQEIRGPKVDDWE